MAAGVEFSDLNWLAIAAAMAFNIVLGFLWYGAKMPTGKIWMKAMKIPPGAKPTAKQMAVSMTLMVIGTLLLMFVMSHIFVAYRDAFRIDGDAMYKLTAVDGVVGAVMIWAGFFVPLHLGSVAWEGKPWSLFFVNTLYYLVALLVAGQIFVAMPA